MWFLQAIIMNNLEEGQKNNLEDGQGEATEQPLNATLDTDYRPEEGLSPTAWRNLKIGLVIGGILGNLSMRFGLVELSNLAN